MTSARYGPDHLQCFYIRSPLLAGLMLLFSVWSSRPFVALDRVLDASPGHAVSVSTTFDRVALTVSHRLFLSRPCRSHSLLTDCVSRPCRSHTVFSPYRRVCTSLRLCVSTVSLPQSSHRNVDRVVARRSCVMALVRHVWRGRPTNTWSI